MSLEKVNPFCSEGLIFPLMAIDFYKDLNNYFTESLDDLERMVVEMFVEVENKGVDIPEWPDHPFNKDHYEHKWYIVPVKDVRTLKMIFPLPELRDHYKSDVSTRNILEIIP